MGKIIWLASYPKSGNTWLRTWLTNIRRNSDEPASINELDGSHIASDRAFFDEIAGVEASSLMEEEIEWYRPLVYLQLAQEVTEEILVKVHDAYTYNSRGLPLFPPQLTSAVLYIIRNPLDVTVSLAHHLSISVSEAAERMCNYQDIDPMFASQADMPSQLQQKWLTWSRHARSWIDGSGLNVYVVRYEDMLLNGVSTLTAILRFLGWQYDIAQITKAIEFSSMEYLQIQERTMGFREKPSRVPTFFRKGVVGDWRNVLTAEQVHNLVEAHREVMVEHSYLNQGGDPVF